MSKRDGSLQNAFARTCQNTACNRVFGTNDYRQMYCSPKCGACERSRRYAKKNWRKIRARNERREQERTV